MDNDLTGLQSMSFPQHFGNKARLCSPYWSIAMKGSLEFQRSVKQLGKDITFLAQDKQQKRGDSIHTFSLKKKKTQTSFGWNAAQFKQKC